MSEVIDFVARCQDCVVRYCRDLVITLLSGSRRCTGSHNSITTNTMFHGSFWSLSGVLNSDHLRLQDACASH